MPQCRCSDSQLHEAVALLSIIFPKTVFWDPGTAPMCALCLPTDHQDLHAGDLLGAHTEQERRSEPRGHTVTMWLVSGRDGAAGGAARGLLPFAPWFQVQHLSVVFTLHVALCTTP